MSEHCASCEEKEDNKALYRIIISLVLFISSYFFSGWLNLLLLGLGYVIVGYKVILEAFENLFKGKMLDENFLMMIATFGAIYTKQYPEALAVMLFYEVGEYLEDLSVERSKKSITDLMDLRPDHANKIMNDKIEKVDPSELALNDSIIVYPGEKIPVDGTVYEGISSLDTVALTGESLPQEVSSGSKVLSGSVNLVSPLKIQVNKIFAESTASKILDLVTNAKENKSQSEDFVTKFAHYYTPIVVGVALVIAFIVPIFTQQWSEYLYRACIFLVISCPCALVISIPLGFFSGIGKAGKEGILFKGSNYLERFSKLKTLYFDKTGTLSKGKLAVTKIIPFNGTVDETLFLADLLEQNSLHPLGMAIKNEYGKENKEKVTDFKEIAGQGIIAKYKGDLISVGNDTLMNQQRIEIRKIDSVGTLIYVGKNEQLVGIIEIGDQIKPEAKETLQQLKSLGIKRIMLTGDREEVAKAVNEQLQLDEVKASLLPNEKLEIVDQADQDGVVGFVGDGINDAPVLTRADIGIAMGNIGSDAAIEAADVIIMKDDLAKIITAYKISLKTLKIVKENIIFALAVKLIILILGAFGLANMWAAVFADVGVSLLAILNSMRILYSKKI